MGTGYDRSPGCQFVEPGTHQLVAFKAQQRLGVGIPTASELFLPVAAYLVGAIPFAYLVGRMRGIDLRTSGTGNVGAGNLTRLAGLPWGMTAALFDGLKGLFAVLIARWMGMGDMMAAFAGLAAVVGHNWSVYMGGRSGRGLATSAGVAVALSPILLLWTTGWAVAGWKFGGGFGGFVGWALLPVFALLTGQTSGVVWGAGGLAVLMIVRRMQGNVDRTPGIRAALRRAVFDHDHEDREVATADEPATT